MDNYTQTTIDYNMANFLYSADTYILDNSQNSQYIYYKYSILSIISRDKGKLTKTKCCCL